jgi:hypothetical protein
MRKDREAQNSIKSIEVVGGSNSSLNSDPADLSKVKRQIFTF